LRTEGIHEWDEAGVCTAKCFWCKSMVEIPVQIMDGTQVEDEKFILRKAGTKG
jgi:hypothetical protein